MHHENGTSGDFSGAGARNCCICCSVFTSAKSGGVTPSADVRGG